MIGMAVGLAILTAYGSTTIDRLAAQVYATPDAYLQFIPPTLQDRPLRDPLVVDALEEWASREAARIMVGLFLVAAGVTAARRPTVPRARTSAAYAVGRRTGRRCGRRCRRPRSRWPGTHRTERRPLARRPTRALPAVTGRAGEPVSFRRRNAVSTAGAGAIRRRRRSSATSSARSTGRRGDRARSRRCCASPDASVWVDLAGPSREQVETVGAALGLHPLIVEDVLEGNQRAKIETTDGVVHIVLFHLDYDAALVASETDIVLGRRVPADRHTMRRGTRATSNHLRGGVEPILTHGPDHLLWAIGDDIVDGYFPFADRLGDAIDEVQDAVVQQAPTRRRSSGSSSSSASSSTSAGRSARSARSSTS